MTRAEATKSIRVHFIHGLESSPQGEKSRFLAKHFDACIPAMDTRDFDAAFQTQVEALRDAERKGRSPHVLVGSSFGGALALRILSTGVWRGPTLLLAPAARKLGVFDPLPEGIPITIVHGLQDELIPIEDSRVLAKTGTPGLVRLEEVNDGHRLQGLVASGRLAELVLELYKRAYPPQAPYDVGA
ncbi:MAG: hypothetical protein NZM37_06850 [Sandaracinaceae bacterium]|nr:hypothetical protein [Sandaracinaceae bacterium]MDW8246727.1 YqiA/YcfP family alpha/beta fold hydrolase [Sandaracinaceae bacterium]